MAKNDKRAGDLLAALQRARPATPPAAAPAETVTAPAVVRGGKAVQFWLHEDDRRQIRELAAYLSSQGERPTDSLIVRAALRVVQSDARLVAAFREALSQDGRYRPRNQAESAG